MPQKQPEEVTPGTVWLVSCPGCPSFGRYLAIPQFRKDVFLSRTPRYKYCDQVEQDLVATVPHACSSPPFLAAGLS